MSTTMPAATAEEARKRSCVTVVHAGRIEEAPRTTAVPAAFRIQLQLVQPERADRASKLAPTLPHEWQGRPRARLRARWPSRWWALDRQIRHPPDVEAVGRFLGVHSAHARANPMPKTDASTSLQRSTCAVAGGRPSWPRINQQAAGHSGFHYSENPNHGLRSQRRHQSR